MSKVPRRCIETRSSTSPRPRPTPAFRNMSRSFSRTENSLKDIAWRARRRWATLLSSTSSTKSASSRPITPCRQSTSIWPYLSVQPSTSSQKPPITTSSWSTIKETRLFTRNDKSQSVPVTTSLSAFQTREAYLRHFTKSASVLARQTSIR